MCEYARFAAVCLHDRFHDSSCSFVVGRVSCLFVCLVPCLLVRVVSLFVGVFAFGSMCGCLCVCLVCR